MALPEDAFFAVAILGGGWLQSPASDGPPWYNRQGSGCRPMTSQWGRHKDVRHWPSPHKISIWSLSRGVLIPQPKVTVGQRKKVTAVTFFPARPRPDQRGTNTGQIRKAPVYEITWFLVYRIGEIRSQLGANDGILVCLVREIWQFKLFAGKEVTGFRDPRGRRLLTARKKVTVLVLKLNSFVSFKTLEIKRLRTYHRLVICTSKHI